MVTRPGCSCISPLIFSHSRRNCRQQIRPDIIIQLSTEREVLHLKTEIRISPDITEPYAVIYAGKMTDEISSLAEVLNHVKGNVLTAFDRERIIILKPEEVYLVRVEDEKTMVYGKEDSYICMKRLYEAEEILGRGFLRISKSAIVNLRCLDSVEPSMSGMMLLKLKNGMKDYVSRKYLPSLKNYLGI